MSGLDVNLKIKKFGSFEKPWQTSPHSQVPRIHSSGCSFSQCFKTLGKSPELGGPCHSEPGEEALRDTKGGMPCVGKSRAPCSEGRTGTGDGTGGESIGLGESGRAGT